jgi:hypothetical protein
MAFNVPYRARELLDWLRHYGVDAFVRTRNPTLRRWSSRAFSTFFIGIFEHDRGNMQLGNVPVRGHE